MTAVQVKILVSVALVLALWRLFELPGVADAFWSFITVGAIPGTNKIIGTESLLRILCVLFAAVFFIVFRKEFMASLPRRGSRHISAQVDQCAGAMGKVATAASAASFQTRNRIIVILTRRPTQPALTPARPVIVFLGRLAAWIVQLTCWVEADCRRLGTCLAVYFRKGYAWTAKQTVRLARRLYRTLRFIGRYVTFTAILTWKLLEPSIRRFDRWLEKQLHTNKSTAEALDFMSGVSRAARDSYRRAEQASRKLRESK